MLQMFSDVLKRTWLFGAAPKHSETQKPGSNARGTQKTHAATCSVLCSPLFIGIAAARFAITVMSHFDTYGVLKSPACWVGSVWMLQKEHEE